MELPNADQAFVERQKITGYLLNADHRDGRHKARFLTEFGFRLEEWSVLAEALRIHGQKNAVGSMKQTGFGSRYEVDGPLETPTGQRPRIRTVWQIDRGVEAPRLITAYPLEKMI